MRIAFLRMALASAMLIVCADTAWAQRSSTFDKGVFFVDVGDAGIDTIQTPSAEQCRASCIGLAQCQAWAWSGSNWGGGCARYRTNQLSREASPPFVSGSVFPSSSAPPVQLFPLPQKPMTLIFRVPSEFDNAERYASFSFSLSEGHFTNVLRRAWEGPLSQADNSNVGDQYVAIYFDEVPVVDGESECEISATPEQLRQIFVGARLTYTNVCNAQHARTGRSSEWETTVVRTVERNERVTVPAGTFDAILVKKMARSVYRSFDANGDEDAKQTTESETLRWWVPSLGFYVKDQYRTRIVDSVYSPARMEENRREGRPPPPRSTEWGGRPAMVAVSIR